MLRGQFEGALYSRARFNTVNYFVHKSLQKNYNDFVWTVTRLNRDMNYSLTAVGLLIRNLAHTIVAVPSDP